MDEEIRQLKAQLAEEKEKTMAAELIAEQALQAGMKSTRNWEKEKKRRKIAEEILRGLQGILHDSVSAGLLRPYQPAEPTSNIIPEEISQMDKQTVRSHCLKYGIDIEGKGLLQLRRELTVQVSAPEPVQETASDVVAIYEKFLTDVELPHFWNMKLLREHANQLGIENTGQDKVTLRESVRAAINTLAKVENPLVLLGHIEERLKQKTCGELNKTTLQTHCKYYSIETSGKSKTELKQLLLQRLN
jgi:hypothetical protein